MSCSGCSGTVFVDDRPAGEIRQGTISLDALSAGTHQLRLTTKSGERRMVFTVGENPSVTLAISSSRNYGTLMVETGEDGATVFIDGREYPRRTVHGQLQVPIEAKEHTVRVVKEGYQAEPAQVRAVVKDGDSNTMNEVVPT